MRFAITVGIAAAITAVVGCEGIVVGEGEGEGEGEGDAGEGEGEGDAGEGEGEGDAGEGEGEGEGDVDEPGWTTLTLLEGADSFHNEDDVTAIFFASLDEGYIGTDGKADVSAVYTATRGAITAFAIPEDALTDIGGDGGDFAVRGIQETSLGVTVTTDNTGAIIVSDDGFATFDEILTNMPGGIAATEALSETPTGWIGLIGSGIVVTSTDDPGPGTLWTETWAPEGIPPIPETNPENGCVYGPRSRATENLYEIGGFSPDRQTVVYVTRSVDVSANDETVVCVSNDGGVTFEARVLPVPEDGPNEVGPTAAVMVSNTVGFVTTADFSSGDGGTAAIWKTTNAGDTWAETTIPAVADTNVLQLSVVFFAPGGTVGYVGGQDLDTDRPLLWKTTDGGDTWVEVAGANGLAAAANAAGTFGRIFSGFALDEDHFWIGGDHGTVFYNSTGGQ